jgi:DNA-binding CsgD family transcriptional regulator
MITLNQKQKIIIAYHRKNKSQRRIARELGLNRRTVARYIKDYDQKRAKLMATADDTQKEELTMVYDNARLMVAKFVGHSEKEPTEALLKLSLYYGFRFRFTNTYQAHEKGHVERSVEYLRRKIFSKCDTFARFSEARAYFKRELSRLNQKCRNNQVSAQEMLEKEKDALLVLPPRYDTARIREARVDRYSTVSVDTNHYSVPDHLVGEFVLVKIYPDRILCYHNQQKIASHKRCQGRDRWQLDINHYLKTLKFKPSALKRSNAFSQIKPELKAIYHNYYQGQEKQFIDLLELVATHSLSKVSQTISMLEKIPTTVNTERIRLILEKKDEPVPILTPSAITRQAKETVCHYSELLGGIRV